jgi:hypothetical protein
VQFRSYSCLCVCLILALSVGATACLSDPATVDFKSNSGTQDTGAQDTGEDTSIYPDVHGHDGGLVDADQPDGSSGEDDAGDPMEMVVLFVSAQGSDDQDGRTPHQPFQTISRALEEASELSAPVRIHVAAGRYEEYLELVDGVSLLGSYDPVDWSRDAQLTSTFVYSGSGLPRTTPVVSAQGLTSPTLLEGFTFVGPDLSSLANGQTATTMSVTYSQNLRLRHVHVIAGTGATGRNRNKADAGGHGEAGTSAGFGAGQGGASACGSAGGSGGEPRGCTFETGQPGTAGSLGNANTGGEGGSGGHNQCEQVHLWNETNGQPGNKGPGGDPVEGGAPAETSLGRFGSSRTWSGLSGSNGQRGNAGAGGGGGGASGRIAIVTDNGTFLEQDGLPGGGGGAGGCGGLAGQNGGHGGASLALVLIGSQVALEEGVKITLGQGGPGGAGGEGGDGGRGGEGGLGRSVTVSHGGLSALLSSGVGARGGDGSPGGGGAGGCGGPSIGIALAESTLLGEPAAYSSDGASGGSGGQGGVGRLWPDGIRGNSGGAGCSGVVVEEHIY